MAFKFEEGKVAATLTTNQQYLSRVEGRIRGLESSFNCGNGEITQKKYDAEHKRLAAALKDVKGRLTKAELKDYKIRTAGMTEDEQRAALKKAQKEMDSNKDKPSI